MAYWTSLTREPHKYPEDYMKQEGGIDELFRQASKIKDDSTRTREELLVERRNDGAKRFIRKAFGFFGNSAVKSLDEMARLLYETGMVSSEEEGRQEMPSFAGKAFCYGRKTLGISEMQDGRGNRVYEIFAFPTTPETETEEMTLRSERWKDRYAMLKKFAHPLRTLCSDIELRWDWR